MTQLCGVLCAPWNGFLLDRHKGKPRAAGISPSGAELHTSTCSRSPHFVLPAAGETEQEADLRSSCLSLFLTSLQSLVFSVCVSIPVLPLQYLTFILQVLNRSFLYGGNAAFISIAWVPDTNIEEKRIPAWTSMVLRCRKVWTFSKLHQKVCFQFKQVISQHQM